LSYQPCFANLNNINSFSQHNAKLYILLNLLKIRDVSDNIETLKGGDRDWKATNTSTQKENIKIQ